MCEKAESQLLLIRNLVFVSTNLQGNCFYSLLNTKCDYEIRLKEVLDQTGALGFEKGIREAALQ